ncbi:MAG: hypothetical protein ACFB2Z_01940 [Maricaulaceae bacterium]
MGWRIVFTPLIPEPWLWLLGGLALVTALACVVLATRGGTLRALAALALIAALSDPSFIREEREFRPDIALLLVDGSESMTYGERAQASDAVAEALRAQAQADPTLELVEARIPRGDDGTRLYEALRRGLGEIPPERLAGVFALTDGQPHDAPEDIAAWAGEISAPVHAFIVGDLEAADRRLVIVSAPRFGIVGERARFTVRVEDDAAAPGETAQVSLSLDGGAPITADVVIGEDVGVELAIQKRGPNVVQVEVNRGAEEITEANNRTAVNVTGVRDRLRVLLVTGEPHPGARAWRNLLKSDPSVDLVHFTILRPPEKTSFVPAEELSLIEFPRHELFSEKIDDFDLIIFDRYKRRSVLQPIYLENVARHVEKGGALLLAAGPPFAGPLSLHLTPLSSVLPLRPTGQIQEGPFRAAVTEVGARHPVTAGLADIADPQWGRWFRTIEASAFSGDAVLRAPNDLPLLVLDRVGEGRVAQLMTDQAWLWARGVDGGGPYNELFRRLGHWLMAEPELEEERLSAQVVDGRLQITRRSLSEVQPPAQIIGPDGVAQTAAFAGVDYGLFQAEAAAEATGLYRIRSGELTAVAAAGALNPREVIDPRPSREALRPLSEATGGGVFALGEGEAAAPPDLRRTRADARQAGRNWAGLKQNRTFVAARQDRQPLAPALLAVAVILGLSAAAWAREGR